MCHEEVYLGYECRAPVLHEARARVDLQRIKAMLRTRGHYSTESLILQFKCHLWGLMPAHTGGIFHAATSILVQLDKTQKHFLKELGGSESTAFLEFNFASPTLRRIIAVLDMVHKKMLGK